MNRCEYKKVDSSISLNQLQDKISIVSRCKNVLGSQTFSPSHQSITQQTTSRKNRNMIKLISQNEIQIKIDGDQSTDCSLSQIQVKQEALDDVVNNHVLLPPPQSLYNQPQQQKVQSFSSDNNVNKARQQGQSKLKNANKYYFKRILKILKNEMNSNQVRENGADFIQSVANFLGNIESIEPKDSYGQKHFRLCCYKLDNKSVSKMKQNDQDLHKKAFKALWDQKSYQEINKIKNFLSREILIILEQKMIIQDEIKNTLSKLETVELYVNWSQNISVHVRKLMNGDYVSRF